MNKKTIIIGVVLISMIISFAALVSALHPSSDPQYNSACEDASTSPSLVLVSNPNGEPNKYTLTVEMHNKGYEDWADLSEDEVDTSYKLKLLNGPGNLRNTYLSLASPTPGVHLVSGGGIATFVLPEQTAPTSPAVNPGQSFEWRMVKIIETEGRRLEVPIPVDGSSTKKCSLNVRIEKIDAKCENLQSAESVRVWRNEYLPFAVGGGYPEDQEILLGEDYVLRVKLKNTGTTTWDTGDYVLEGKINGEVVTVSIGSSTNNAQTPGQINQQRRVEPTKDAIIEFRGIAPENPDDLSTEWGLKLGTLNFGETCRKTILVRPKRDGALCENMLLWTDPTKRTLNMEVKLKNTGNTLWKPNKYTVGPPPGIDNLLINRELSLTQVQQGNNQVRIFPGETVRLTNSVAISDLNRYHTFRDYTVAWIMKNEDEEFGEVCRKNVAIKPRFAVPPPGSVATGFQDWRAGTEGDEDSESGDSP